MNLMTINIVIKCNSIVSQSDKNAILDDYAKCMTELSDAQKSDITLNKILIDASKPKWLYHFLHVYMVITIKNTCTEAKFIERTKNCTH
jgi:hypothetical protein